MTRGDAPVTQQTAGDGSAGLPGAAGPPFDGLRAEAQQIDTTTAQGRLVFHLLGGLDEFGEPGQGRNQESRTDLGTALARRWRSRA